MNGCGLRQFIQRRANCIGVTRNCTIHLSVGIESSHTTQNRVKMAKGIKTEVLHGDCREVLKDFPDNYFDAVVCDPPFGLEFMGKEWDRLWTNGGDAFSEDKKWGRRPAAYKPRYVVNRKCKQCGKWSRDKNPCKCEVPDWEMPKEMKGDSHYAIAMQEWHFKWATEVLRVLKPGGHLLAFGGTRTSHRLVCAIEDAGFEIRDSISWIFSQGFPKSQNISAAIDKSFRRDFVLAAIEAGIDLPGRSVDDWTKEYHSPGNRWWEIIKKGISKEDLEKVERVFVRKGLAGKTAFWRRWNEGDGTFDITAPATTEAQYWQGFGTGLKPSIETICMSRKPLSEPTVAANILKWGTGGLNIDGGRIDYLGDADKASATPQGKTTSKSGRLAGQAQGGGERSEFERPEQKGRWPANLILQHTEDCVQAGTKKVKTGTTNSRKGTGSFAFGDHEKKVNPWVGVDGKEEVESWRCHPDCPVKMLDEQSGERPHSFRTSRDHQGGDFKWKAGNKPGFDDSGGASRFFYQAKSSPRERFFLCPTCDTVDNDRKAHKDHDIVFHPTQKPIDLMRYLVRLVTPPKGIILDPFVGSGSTLVAAKLEEFDGVGIDQDLDYVRIAEHRIKYARKYKAKIKPITPERKRITPFFED